MTTPQKTASVTAVLNDTFRTTRFDFLINNAGISLNAPFAQSTEVQVDFLLNIQFRSAFFLTRSALPFIADGGRLINLSSGLARFCMPGYSAYTAMKGAVETLTRLRNRIVSQ